MQDLDTKKTYVKYRNAFNKANLGGLSVIASNLLMAIAAKIVNQGTNDVTFSDDELMNEEIIGNRSRNEMIAALDSIAKSLIKITATIETPQYVEYVTVFQKFRINKETDENPRLIVKVQPEYKFLFNELQDNFTLFELREFASLRSTRAKTLYRFLKQYRTTGNLYINLSDVVLFFEVPEAFQKEKKFIKQKVLDPATKECGRYFSDLKIESVKAPRGKGHPIIGYKWTFKAEKSRKNLIQTNTKSSRNGNKDYKKSAWHYSGERDYNKDFPNLERQLANSANN